MIIFHTVLTPSQIVFHVFSKVNLTCSELSSHQINNPPNISCSVCDIPTIIISIPSLIVPHTSKIVVLISSKLASKNSFILSKKVFIILAANSITGDNTFNTSVANVDKILITVSNKP